MLTKIPKKDLVLGFFFAFIANMSEKMCIFAPIFVCVCVRHACIYVK